MERELSIRMDVYPSSDELRSEDAELLWLARRVTENAYAPYSNFRVGAAGKMADGTFITGTNQENAAFPAGICAERVLLSAAASLYPGAAIDTIAVSYHNLKGGSGRPISPCGICRQSLLEFQTRTGQPMRVILSGQTGEVFILRDAADLLPLVFSAEDMK